MDLLQFASASSTQGVPLYRPIPFVPASSASYRAQHQNAGLSSHHKLIPLNEPQQQQADAAHQQMPGPLLQREGSLMAPKSKGELFREEDVQLRWQSVTRAAVGLQNLGNTCFMNSVLQCLTHTPPLAEAVLSGKASCPPGTPSDDPLAVMLAHIRRVFAAHGIVRPIPLVKTLKSVNRRFRVGRQEDAHEYLRCLLDAMHESCLRPFKPKPPPHLVATTFVNRIFGARLRSRVKCHGVDYESSTYEPFMDLSLEINRASTVTRALQHFCAVEMLDGDNKYRCPKNNKLVRAEKQITIEEAPNVLTVHLKRFQFGGVGSKISKMVEYDKEMNLQQFMSSPDSGPQVTGVHRRSHHTQESLHDA